MNAVFALAFLAGLLLPSGTLSAEVRTLLITFFGLLSAGILPALTVVVSVPPPASFSVARLQRWDQEIRSLIKGLISTLAFILFGGVMVLAGAVVKFPVLPVQGLAWAKYLTDAPERVFQAVVLACFCVAIDRLRVFVTAFNTMQTARHQGAVEDARRRLEASVPQPDQVRASFQTSSAHGALRAAVTHRDPS